MNHLRTIRTLAALLVVTMIAGVAFAQTTSDATATVTAVNTLSMTAGGTIALAPAVGAPASDGATSLSYETNDGQTYKITASATTWAFTPSVTGISANTYPLLTVAATSTAGTGLNATELIGTGNAATPRDIVTGLTSTTGTASVTLEASVTETVVAGGYATTITYSLVTP